MRASKDRYKLSTNGPSRLAKALAPQGEDVADTPFSCYGENSRQFNSEKPQGAGWKPALQESTLAGLEAGVGFVDDVNPALAADHLVVAVTLDQRLERIADFHVFHPK